MRYRQIHLDFHTSEKIPGIGSRFSKENFQKALKAGHVDSITVFSKCHHGWAYHPSKANEMHPELSFDLLGAQIEAAHEIGVKTPVYISAGFDEKYAVKHHDQVSRTIDQKTVGADGDFMHPGYHMMCLNSPYLEVLLAQIKEVCENYDADGIFLDIVGVRHCYCQYCLATMAAEGLDPEKEEDEAIKAEMVYANYTRRVRETIDSVKPGLPVFHNAGHIRRGRRDLAYANTHLELESLPTGGWGYDHFPLSASYSRTLGQEFLGMTGKFHFSWGEFGGFKHPNALRYEAALSIANGAKCSVGDQLHPWGEMDLATYELIGAAYQEVEEKEGYLEGAHNVADIAVLGAEAITNYLTQGKGVAGNRNNKADIGCSRILLEGNYLFNYIDAEEDLAPYKLVILPDGIVLDEALRAKLQAFVDRGGKLLASGTSATDERGSFLFDFGCTFQGENAFKPDYCRPAFEMEGLGNSAYVLYSQGYSVEAGEGTVHAYRENSFFNRTREHFCSHKHTPNDPTVKLPAVVEGKDGIYIGWNIFEEYATHGCLIAKRMVCRMLDLLLQEPSVKTNLPSQGVVTLMEKGERQIAHLLFATPIKRGEGVEVIEELHPLYDTELLVKREKEVHKVYLAPQEEELPYTVADGYVKVTLDKFVCHQMIVIE